MGNVTDIYVWAAQKMNAFQRYGLNASIKRLNSGPIIVASLTSGEIQFGHVTAGTTVDAMLGGAKLATVGTPVTRAVQEFYVAPQINSVADLRGKAVGINARGALTEYLIRWVLEQNGLKPDKDVPLVVVGGTSDSLAALTSNRIVGVLLNEPSALKARKLGFKPLVDFNKTDYLYPQQTIASPSSYVHDNSAVVKAYLAALGEATARLKKDKPFALDLVKLTSGSSDPEEIEAAYNEVVASDALQDIPINRESAFKTVLDNATDQQKAAATKPSDYYTNEFVGALQEAGFYRSIGVTDKP